ncbi:putative F1F0 ATP synthase assembly protein Atp11 [Cercophora newfieldiana]|uniref:F1F0 ATP synthase assembly protein Atp11 n=1 Tax=Cercophora newfieldiana TaxID=92897 RepID=A0AA39YR91_9PEZI|nr:putative F1F0 ATP synthase assembly protein Atp11 [Cercophora newfieldiana]
MATIRVPTLRHLATSGARFPRLAQHQRRWAQVHDVRVRFLATSQANRSILEKYREKLESKARAEGHGDIDTLKKAYSDKINSLRKETDRVVPPQLLNNGEQQQPFSSEPQTQQPTPSPSPTAAKARSFTSSDSPSGIKPLSSILNLPKALTLPPTELTAIWRLRHAANPHSLCAVIPASTFSAIDTTARQFPQFLLPIPHPSQGAEMHFLQWTWDAATRSSTVLFTQLAEYKARGEFAAPHTTITHYTDLALDKGVVLMQGTVAEDRGVKVEDAKWLVMCLQRFYGGWDGSAEDKIGRERAMERRKLLEWFARGDGRFSVERLLEEAERMG